MLLNYTYTSAERCTLSKESRMLILRREALHNRTSIPKDEIVPVVFNEHAYYEFK